MNAEPLLKKISVAMSKVGLEAIMVGNAAAALHGAPVTTIDLDFMFRKTSTNLRKLKLLAKELEAYILKPYYPLSGLYRIVNDDIGMQLDFLSNLHGIKSFESLRAKSEEVEFEGCKIIIAGLDSIIKSKKALNRKKDKAVLEILEKTLGEKDKKQKKSTRRAKKRK